MADEGEAPYWREAYGIARPWRSSPRRQRGCTVALGAAIILIVVILVLALVFALS